MSSLVLYIWEKSRNPGSFIYSFSLLLSKNSFRLSQIPFFKLPIYFTMFKFRLLEVVSPVYSWMVDKWHKIAFTELLYNWNIISRLLIFEIWDTVNIFLGWFLFLFTSDYLIVWFVAFSSTPAIDRFEFGDDVVGGFWLLISNIWKSNQ